ncbi:MAG TPA: HesA/MoeB/ThiF family protein, partial [Candidatus Woesearchaeota archaeon]|nr:HesA/MoeB/ThiF family protein [Candidatus Woesearchaeota archaeon]
MSINIIEQWEAEFFSRQDKVIGVKKRKLLQEKTILVVGCGGLGSFSGELSARSGASVILIDDDKVSLENIQRQNFTMDDLGKSKADACAEKISRIIGKEPESIRVRLHENNATEIIRRSDLVLDCTDNLKSREIINKSCFEVKKPFVYASVEGFIGYASLIAPYEEGACLACFIDQKEKPRKEAEQTSVFGSLPISVAGIQATLALRWL